MSLLLETIQILNGKPQRLDYHNDRLNRSRNQLMCSHADIYLEDYLQIPEEFTKAKVKCRILYGQDIDKIEFSNYTERVFSKFLFHETILDYPFKYTDRSAFDKIKSKLPASTEIIFIKDQFITDTTFSNIVFKHKSGKWYTPSKPLLEGTQREFLLDEEILDERDIKIKDLNDYSHFMLINAMLDFHEYRALDIRMLSKTEA